MTGLPEWVETVAGLVGRLTATPIRVTKKAQLVAAYLGVSFAEGVATAFKLGIARPLSEFSESTLQRIKSQNIAEAQEAHNRALLTKAEAEEKLANAEATKIRANAEAAKTNAEARAIDGKLALERLDRERAHAENARQQAEARLAEAVRRLRDQGGELYIEPPESEQNDERSNVD